MNESNEYEVVQYLEFILLFLSMDPVTKLRINN